MRRVVTLLAAVLALAGFAGCGGGAEPGASGETTLMLDFTPNPAHLGLYAAQAEGMYEGRGIDMKIETPGETTDAPKLLAAGRVDFAILDIHDLGIARENGLDLVGLAPITKFPLAAILTRLGGPINSPRDLMGRTVGVAGLPSDDAVVDSEVEAVGGDPSKVKRVTVGFNGITALVSGKVDAITAFWKTDSAELQRRGVTAGVFKVEDFGAPTYPELVLATSRDKLESDPELVRDVTRATQRGYEFAVENSEAAVDDMIAANPELDRGELQGETLTFLIAIQPEPFDPIILEEWAEWDLEHGILQKPLKVKEAFDLSVAGY